MTSSLGLMRRFVPTAALSLLLVLSGCFTVSSVITVRPDGSATLRDSVAFSGMFASLMQEGDDGIFAAPNENAQARARALGDGVTVERVDASESGYVAVYDVPDIRALRYTADFDAEEGPSERPVDSDVTLSFLFDQGDPATLRVIVQKPSSTKPPPSADVPDVGDGMGNMADLMDSVSGMVGDARMTVSLRVEGEIVETTAAYAEGSEITLFDLPLSALIESADVFAQIGTEQMSSADAYAALNAIDGIRIQKPGTVRVQFR